MAHPLLEKAAQHIKQARAINDEFDGRDMPAEAAHTMNLHLQKAAEYRNRVQAEAALQDTETWLAEPEYKHDMSGGGGERIPASFGSSSELLETERKAKVGQSFFDYLRKGVDGIQHEVKADLVENTTGEIIVPADYAGIIQKDIKETGVIRSLATVRPTTSNRVELGSITVGAPAWGKLETAQGVVPAPDGLGNPPVNAKDVIRVWNLNALVKLGTDELEDTNENILEIIQSQLGVEFGESEDDAFAAGTGDVGFQPDGIVNGIPAGNIVAATAGQTVTADDLKSLPYEVSAGFRRGGVYLWHSGVEAAATLLKGTDGHYLWQPALYAAEYNTFDGYRCYAVDGLPAMTATVDVGAGTDLSVVFGDIRRGYMVADRRRLTVQRLVELYAEDGKVGFMFTHRVGGGTIRPLALAGLTL